MDVSSRAACIVRLASLALAMVLFGCVDSSPTIVTFDQQLESTTFNNQLFAPVVIFRNDSLLDTLGARQSRSYAIDRRGAIRHTWQLIAPRGSTGQPAGIEPRVDLGVQYKLNAVYTINNDAVPAGTIFTPRVLNASGYDLRLTVNFGVSDQFITDYYIRANANSSLTNAPYYYWNYQSNVLLSGGLYTNSFSRTDTSAYRLLRISDSIDVRGSGITEPLLAR